MSRPRDSHHYHNRTVKFEVSGTVLFLAIVAATVLFWGEPDLVDAAIQYLTK